MQQVSTQVDHQHLLKLGCCSKHLDRWHLDLESICFPHAHWRPDSGILSLGPTAAAADPVPRMGYLSDGCALEEQAQSLQGTLIYDLILKHQTRFSKLPAAPKIHQGFQGQK